MAKVTQAQITQWKKQWGGVYSIEVPLDDNAKEKAVGYFKKPTLDTIKASSKYIESDPIKAGEVVFNNCWLGGDAEIKDNDEVKMSAMQQVSSLFKVRQATLKKL